MLASWNDAKLWSHTFRSSSHYLLFLFKLNLNFIWIIVKYMWVSSAFQSNIIKKMNSRGREINYSFCVENDGPQYLKPDICAYLFSFLFNSWRLVDWIFMIVLRRLSYYLFKMCLSEIEKHILLFFRILFIVLICNICYILEIFFKYFRMRIDSFNASDNRYLFYLLYYMLFNLDGRSLRLTHPISRYTFKKKNNRIVKKLFYILIFF